MRAITTRFHDTDQSNPASAPRKLRFDARIKTVILSPVTMSEDNGLIHWEQLDMMADGYTPDFVAIYREFTSQTPELLDLIDREVVGLDFSAVRETAHKIKGSSANFGFVGVSTPMAELELQAREQRNLDGAEEKIRLARENFEKSCQEVRLKRGM